MVGVTDLWTYVLGTVAIILLPGPNSIFVLVTAAGRGVAAGYRGAAGVFLGDTVLMVLSAAGVASLMRAFPPLFLVVKYAGAAYLCYLGATLVRGAVRRWRSGAADRSDREPARPRRPRPGGRSTAEPVGSADVAEAPGAAPGAADRPFRRALVISLLNPKAILFFVSFFVQFVDPAYPHPVLSFLLLGLIAQAMSLLYLTVLIFAGSYLAAQFRRRRRLAAGATTGVGALFVGFGVALATAGLH
ncbi:MAG TPA: leucine efflux protein LeuE [Pilimelia sp.]|nr:leucine efflux protein LeuE [Pilimelia sp.]